MALTNVKDFKELLNIIPKEVLKQVWFFPIKQDRKNPDVPSGTILKGNLAYRLSHYDAINRLKWGKNVGIYALKGGLMFLDLDVKNGKLLSSQSFLDTIALNTTLTIQTRNGGIQKYYLNDGEYNNQVIKENGIAIGELRTDWFYVVSVGSYVIPDENAMGGDGTYRISEKYNGVSKFNGLPIILKRGEIKKDETKIINNPGAQAISLENYNISLAQKGKIRRLKNVV
jgi:hypothetical protein